MQNHSSCPQALHQKLLTIRLTLIIVLVEYFNPHILSIINIKKIKNKNFFFHINSGLSRKCWLPPLPDFTFWLGFMIPESPLVISDFDKISWSGLFRKYLKKSCRKYMEMFLLFRKWDDWRILCLKSTFSA